MLRQGFLWLAWFRSPPNSLLCIHYIKIRPSLSTAGVVSVFDVGSADKHHSFVILLSGFIRKSTVIIDNAPGNPFTVSFSWQSHSNGQFTSWTITSDWHRAFGLFVWFCCICLCVYKFVVFAWLYGPKIEDGWGEVKCFFIFLCLNFNYNWFKNRCTCINSHQLLNYTRWISNSFRLLRWKVKVKA